MSEKKITIRLETKDDYRNVENLTREAFWNVYRPGCMEYYVLHCYRDDPAFVPELDFVMELDGELIGQVIYVWSEIDCDDGRKVPIMTFGPIGIAPAYKRQGYGKKLLDYGACGQAHGTGQLCRSFAAYLVPAAFQRPKDYVDQKRNRATDQKWREQRKHRAEKTQNSVKVYQCPCEYDQQHQCAGNIANDRLVRPFAFLRRGILISVTGCVLRFLRHVSSFPLLCTGPFKSESTFAALYTHPTPKL